MLLYEIGNIDGVTVYLGKKIELMKITQTERSKLGIGEDLSNTT